MRRNNTIMKTKTLLVVLLLVFSMIFTTSCVIGSNKHISNDPQDYIVFLSEIDNVASLSGLDGATKYMPDLSELGSYDSITVCKKTTNQVLWNDVLTVTLILDYSEQEYNSQIEMFKAKYTFLSEPNDVMRDCEAEVKGYHIRVVEQKDTPNGDYDYSTFCLLIGTNPEKNKIAYMFYYDFDNDKIKDLDIYVNRFFVIN